MLNTFYSRFGTWPVAMLAPSKNKAVLEGPVCNASQVIGWHTNEKSKRLRRFHVDMSGFAFNSTILWDPKRWQRPTSNPIRQLDTVKEGFQVCILWFTLQFPLPFNMFSYPCCCVLFCSLISSIIPIISKLILSLVWQETSFIEQLVEDESQMEASPHGCLKIMNWHLHLGARDIDYPKGWMLQKNLDAVIPIK